MSFVRSISDLLNMDSGTEVDQFNSVDTPLYPTTTSAPEKQNFHLPPMDLNQLSSITQLLAAAAATESSDSSQSQSQFSSQFTSPYCGSTDLETEVGSQWDWSDWDVDVNVESLRTAPPEWFVDAHANTNAIVDTPPPFTPDTSLYEMSSPMCSVDGSPVVFGGDFPVVDVPVMDGAAEIVQQRRPASLKKGASSIWLAPIDFPEIAGVEQNVNVNMNMNVLPALPEFAVLETTSTNTTPQEPSTIIQALPPTTISQPIPVASPFIPPPSPEPTPSANSPQLQTVDEDLTDGPESPPATDGYTTKVALVHRKKRRVTQLYGCTYPDCDRSFTRQFNLKAHLETHNPHRTLPFKCQVCDKSFSRSHDLRRHKGTHAQEKNYVCNVPTCRKPYARQEALRRHLVSVHGQSLEELDL